MQVKRSFPASVNLDRAGRHFGVLRDIHETPSHRAKRIADGPRIRLGIVGDVSGAGWKLYKDGRFVIVPAEKT